MNEISNKKTDSDTVSMTTSGSKVFPKMNYKIEIDDSDEYNVKITYTRLSNNNQTIHIIEKPKNVLLLKKAYKLIIGNHKCFKYGLYRTYNYISYNIFINNNIHSICDNSQNIIFELTKYDALNLLSKLIYTFANIEHKKIKKKLEKVNNIIEEFEDIHN